MGSASEKKIPQDRDGHSYTREGGAPNDSEARLRALFRGARDALVVIDFKGVILDASASVETLFGWAPEELIGQNIRLLMPEPFRSEHDSYLKRYRETGKTFILDALREFPIARRDGQVATCELSVSRVEVPGQEALFIGSFRDITQRQADLAALKASEERFRAVFEQEFQFVGLLQPDGLLLEANRAGLAIVNAQLEDVIGQPLWDGPWFAHSQAERERIRKAVQLAAAGETVREIIEIVTGKDAIRVVDFSLKSLLSRNGKVEQLIAEGRDITDLKRAQERETGMLRALAEIGESASILVHEIKNPITAVNLALAAVAEKLGEDQRVIIEDLSIRMKKLEKTMRRTLSFAKPLELERKDEDVAILFDEVSSALAPELQQRGEKLVVRVPDQALIVFGDRGLLEELLTNLVRNSMDALSDASAAAKITLSGIAQGDKILIDVADNGPGVPPRQREHLFEPFQTTKLGGTGLGLPFCRKVAEEHGGSIEYMDAPEGGALFRVTLPRVVGTSA